MKVGVDEQGNIVLKEIYNFSILETKEEIKLIFNFSRGVL